MSKRGCALELLIMSPLIPGIKLGGWVGIFGGRVGSNLGLSVLAGGVLALRAALEAALALVR